MNKMLRDAGCDTKLTAVDAVKNDKPVIDGHGNRIELDAIDKGRRGAVHTLGRTVLPESAQAAVGVVRIFGAVAKNDIGLF